VEVNRRSKEISDIRSREGSLVGLDMPLKTGIDLPRAIRADLALKSTPVLMVTAEGNQKNIVEAMQAGVNNYIVKPFNTQTLQENLNKIFPRESEDHPWFGSPS
jgi:two-component system chemotaxis response regulator CheY